MDDRLRDVMIVILERLRQLEEGRQKDLALLMAAVRTIRRASPSTDKQFKTELREIEDAQATHPEVDLDGLYAGLIALLRDPGHSEEEKQDEFRRILEAFEGPKQ